MKIIETSWAWKNALSYRTSTAYIVLHHAAAKTCTAAQIDQWHKSQGWTGIGYHYFVRKDGSIYRGRPENTVGAQVANHNSNSIGICAEGDYSTEQTMPQPQQAAITALIKDIKTRYPAVKVVPHKYFGDSVCPGEYYPLAAITAAAESKEETMTAEEKAEFNALKQKVSDLEAELTAKTKRYDYIKDMPEYAKNTIEHLYNSGVIEGNEADALMLSEDMIRIFVILERANIIK